MSPADTPSVRIDLDDYAYTCRLSRSRWAWEFLRRNSEFRQAALRAGDSQISEKPACHGIRLLRPLCDQIDAEKFGLVLAEPWEGFWSTLGSFWDPGPLILSVSCRRDANSQKFVFFMFGLTFL